MVMNDRKLGKVLKYSLAEDEGDEADYKLTFRQARALLQTLEYLKWMSRHLSLPSDLSDQKSLNDWVQDLEYRLLKEVPPMPLNCEELYDCADTIDDIFTDAITGSATDAEQALRDALDQYLSNYVNNYFDKGSAFRGPEISADNDLALFGQCVKIVEYTHDIWDDVLQQLEEVSNNAELIKHGIDSMPFVKFLTDAIPVDAWLDDLDYILSIEQEGFEAGYTVSEPDGTKFILACSIYCLCLEDHLVTVDRIYNGFTSLLSGYTVPSFENLDNWLSTLLGVDDNDPLIVYATYSMLWGVARLSSFFGTVRLSNATLTLILEVGGKDTSRDPNTYCLDCAGPRVKLINGAPSIWPVMTITFVGADEDDPAYDVFDIASQAIGFGVNVGGTVYDYGSNVVRDIGGGFHIEKVTNMDAQSSATTVGSDSGTDFDVTLLYTQVGMFTVSAGTTRVRVKA